MFGPVYLLRRVVGELMFRLYYYAWLTTYILIIPFNRITGCVVSDVRSHFITSCVADDVLSDHFRDYGADHVYFYHITDSAANNVHSFYLTTYSEVKRSKTKFINSINHALASNDLFELFCVNNLTISTQIYTFYLGTCVKDISSMGCFALSGYCRYQNKTWLCLVSRPFLTYNIPLLVTS